MKAVLDAPVPAHKCKKLGRACPFRLQAGYGVNGLDHFLAPHDVFAGDRSGFNLAGINPAVTFSIVSARRSGGGVHSAEGEKGRKPV